MKMSKVASHAEWIVKADHTPCLIGGTGIGKSATVRQFFFFLADGRKVVDSIKPNEDEYGFIDFRLPLYESVDLGGLPFINSDGQQKRAFLGNLPTGGEGLLFLDEVAQAHPSVVCLVSQLISDKRLGEYVLPKGWRVVLACNRVSDRASSNRLPTHLVERVQLIECDVQFEDWERWGTENKVHAYVMGYLSFQPQALNIFDAKSDGAQANPRSWTRLSDILKTGLPKDMWREMAVSSVGELQATEFANFIMLMDDVPNLSDIVNGVEAQVPTKGGVCYATCIALMDKIETASNDLIHRYFENALAFVSGMDTPEFSIFFVRQCVARRPELKDSSAYSGFKINNQHIEY